MLGIELWAAGPCDERRVRAAGLGCWRIGGRCWSASPWWRFSVRRTPGTVGTIWRGALVLAGVALAWILLSFAGPRDTSLARRALDARANELTLRALEPGSTLACLDGVVTPPSRTLAKRRCSQVLRKSPPRFLTSTPDWRCWPMDCRSRRAIRSMRLRSNGCAAHSKAIVLALSRMF